MEWPVPQIIVFFRELKLAYGRAGIARLGYRVCHLDSFDVQYRA